jgi:hypothetical protein
MERLSASFSKNLNASKAFNYSLKIYPLLLENKRSSGTTRIHKGSRILKLELTMNILRILQIENYLGVPY